MMVEISSQGPRPAQVLFSDDFEATLVKWADYGTGIGHGVARITTKAFHGEACLRVTSGNGNYDVGEAVRGIGWRPSGKFVEYEFWFSLTSLTNVNLFWCKAEVRDGVNREEYQIRWVIATGDITIRTPAGYETLGTKPKIAAGDQLFHYLRCVFDPVAKLYKSVQIDDRVYYPVNKAPYPVADPTFPDALLLVLAVSAGTGGTSVTADFDDIALKEHG